MKTIYISLPILALLLLSGLTLATALLQIDNYTITPDPVYSGTVGYLQITLKNTGDATATSTSANYNVNGVSGTIPLGDISAGSSVPAVVPFKIAAESAGGIQLIGVDVIYYDTTSTTGSSTQVSGSNSKRVSLQVPLEIAQPNPLEVSTISLSKPAVTPGESFRVTMQVNNIGGQTNNLVITTPANSTFSLDGISQKVVGTIESNSSQNVSIDLIPSSATSVGTYTIPIVFTYYDRLNRPTSITLSVGPVSVQSSSTQYRLQMQTTDVAEIGSQVNLHLTLSNDGSRPISAVVDMNSSDTFTPIGAQRMYFDSIAPNSSATQDIAVGVSSSAAAGYYPLAFIVTPDTGSAFSQSYGLAVKATPALSISLDQSGTPSEVMIANTGNSQVRSVDVTVTPKNSPTSGVQSFIGTLNVDDYSTIPLTNLQSGVMEVKVSFRDSTNQIHTLIQELDESSGLASGNSTQGSAFSRNGTARAGAGGGLLGGLLGGGRPGGSTTSGGLPLPLIIAGAVVVIVIAFFVWRHFKGSKKKETPIEPKEKREPSKN